VHEQSESEPCWGSAYEVAAADQEAVLASLDHRERGGYDRIPVEIHLQPDSGEGIVATGLMYIAHTDNDNYLGPATTDEIAKQILIAAGPSGTNPEYVFELAQSLRAMGAHDRHVFEVESKLARLVRESAE